MLIYIIMKARSLIFDNRKLTRFIHIKKRAVYSMLGIYPQETFYEARPLWNSPRFPVRLKTNGKSTTITPKLPPFIHSFSHTIRS